MTPAVWAIVAMGCLAYLGFVVGHLVGSRLGSLAGASMANAFYVKFIAGTKAVMEEQRAEMLSALAQIMSSPESVKRFLISA